ncbi:hypothetical protein LPB140_00895 [Sphingorhabdus lutea]|uniref:MipA/OmpV family protein n=1 Tax=Sphingorhabdus lutea TaxID=1913578 RepID=A0A1L3J920_9SPHN|nr:MipA/OmpV family protein [Sphingorhabdus lutea]APG61632.1 hypothetical protein LPB140_00895 [Sphingorhabdus lutea]
MQKYIPALIAISFLVAHSNPAIAVTTEHDETTQDKSVSTQKTKANNPEKSGPPASFGETIFDDNWVTIGVGVGSGASYEGSDNSRIFPAPIILGKISGYSFGARGPGLYVDFVKNKDKKRVKPILGPQFRVRTDRTGNLKDPVVEQLGERKAAIEIGAVTGVEINKVLNPFDSLTLGADFLFDISGRHNGIISTPYAAYSTPLSRAAFARFSISADIVDDDYAQYYYNVDAQQSSASGLPIFNAKGGAKSVGANLLGGYDLSGNALDGGFSLFGLVSYSRLKNSAAQTPATSIRGTANQWFLAGGVSYSF